MTIVAKLALALAFLYNIDHRGVLKKIQQKIKLPPVGIELATPTINTNHALLNLKMIQSQFKDFLFNTFLGGRVVKASGF